MNIPTEANEWIKNKCELGFWCGYYGVAWETVAKCYGHWARMGYGDGKRLQCLTLEGAKDFVKKCIQGTDND